MPRVKRQFGAALIALLLTCAAVACKDRRPAQSQDRDLTYEDVLFGAALAQIRGHHFVGLQLYRNGNERGALPHAGHPLGEILPTISDTVRSRSAGAVNDLKRSLEAVLSAVNSSKPVADVAKTVSAAAEEVGRVESLVLGSLATKPVYTGSVVAAFLSTASKEYGVSVSRGAVRADIEYQDAYGFSRVAEQIYAGIRAEVTRVGAIEARAIDEAFDQLETFMPSPSPPARPVRFEDVRRTAVLIATRIQETVGALLAAPRTTRDIVDTIRRMLDEMMDAYTRGDHGTAAELASEAYLTHYEEIEIDVIDVAPSVNAELEPILGWGLEELISKRVPVAELARSAARAKTLLASALKALTATPSP